jgi:hypothetical protein
LRIHATTSSCALKPHHSRRPRSHSGRQADRPRDATPVRFMSASSGSRRGVGRFPRPCAGASVPPNPTPAVGGANFSLRQPPIVGPTSNSLASTNKSQDQVKARIKQFTGVGGAVHRACNERHRNLRHHRRRHGVINGCCRSLFRLAAGSDRWPAGFCGRLVNRCIV